MKWNDLSMKDRATLILLGVASGVYDIGTIRDTYNEFAEGGDTNLYSTGKLVNAIYDSSSKEEYMGEPWHHYDFAQSEEWADKHGYYPDARGHRDDRVKKPAHPSHPSRGNWRSNAVFDLTEKGMLDSNHTLFGLADGNQDSQAVLTYKGGTVLPEITVTPSNNYVNNPYDNIRLFAEGGNIRPITTSGSGYIPAAVMPSQIVEDAKNKFIKDVVGDLPMEEVRKRLYRNIAPHGYYEYKNRFKTAIRNNLTSELDTYYPEFDGMSRETDVRMPIWAEYLSIPVNEREYNIYGKELSMSQYKPTRGSEDNIYYIYPKDLSEEEKEELIKDSNGQLYNTKLDTASWEYKQNQKFNKEVSTKQARDLNRAKKEALNVGQNKLSQVLGKAFGTHTIGKGYDNNGEYISYYDKWDLAPYKEQGEDQSAGIGKPVYFYDRIYLDDFYQVPTRYRGGYYLPEVTVTQNEYKNGGKIHIKPENNGGELVNEVDTIPESDLHYTLRKIGRAALAGPIFNLFLPPLLRDTTFVLKNVLKESENKTKSVDDNLLMQQDIIRRIKEVENSKTNPNGGYDAATGRWYPHDSVEGGAPTIAYGFKMDNGSKWTKLAKKLGYLTDELVEEALVDEAKRYSDNARTAYDAVYGDGAFNKLHYKSRSFLTDYEYNPGLKKFPKLMEGFYNGNIDTIRKEYKRYSNKRELGRNKSMALDIDSLAFGPYSIYK